MTARSKKSIDSLLVFSTHRPNTRVYKKNVRQEIDKVLFIWQEMKSCTAKALLTYSVSKLLSNENTDWAAIMAYANTTWSKTRDFTNGEWEQPFAWSGYKMTWLHLLDRLLATNAAAREQKRNAWLATRLAAEKLEEANWRERQLHLAKVVEEARLAEAAKRDEAEVRARQAKELVDRQKQQAKIDRQARTLQAEKDAVVAKQEAKAARELEAANKREIARQLAFLKYKRPKPLPTITADSKLRRAAPPMTEKYIDLLAAQGSSPYQQTTHYKE